MLPPSIRTLAVARVPILVALVAVVVAACGAADGSSPPTAGLPSPGTSGCVAAPSPPDNLEGWTEIPSASVYPILVNSGGSLTCGDNRLLLTFVDARNQQVAAPDRTASIAIYDLGRDGTTPTQSADATFVWGIEDIRGYYTANVQFPEAGDWGAEVTTAVGGGAPEMIRTRFQVGTSTPVVRVGDKAPASDTPTAADVGGDLAMLSSDQNPDPAFYETSAQDALAAGDPFVLVFATPKFCVSAQCGPTLDRVKPLAARFPTVTFINVEPYVLEYQDGSLQPVLNTSVDPPQLTPTQATNDWGLLSEPWVFIVDRDGIVTASFEGVVGTDELAAAIDAVK
jgi:hypothetical protein